MFTMSGQYLSSVSKKELSIAYANSILNEFNHEENILEIVKIIGISNILSDYINEQHPTLNQQQINQLHHLITTLKYKDKTKITRNVVRKENASQNDEFSLILDTNDTCLNAVFGEDIGMKINRFIFNKLILCCSFILFVIGLVMTRLTHWIESSEFILVDIWYWIIYNFITIQWFILGIMSMNRVAAKMTASTFEYYFKMYYAAIGQISLIVYYNILNKDDELYVIRVIFNTMEGLTLILLVGLVSMFDGLQYNKYRKLLIGIIAAVALLYGKDSIQFEYFSFAEDGTDPSIIELSSNIKFSLLSIMSHAFGVVSIFLFKQSFSMYYRMKKGQYKKSIFIKISPNLEWNQTTNNQQQLAQLQVISTTSNQSIDPQLDSDETKEELEQTDIVIAKKNTRESFSITSIV
eukprot:10751_1